MSDEEKGRPIQAAMSLSSQCRFCPHVGPRVDPRFSRCCNSLAGACLALIVLFRMAR